MTQLRKIYQDLRTQNPRLDEGKARQQAWILRDRLLFENTAVASSAAAAAGAAGAGAGGAGGGGRRAVDPSFNNYVENNYIDDYFE